MRIGLAIVLTFVSCVLSAETDSIRPPDSHFFHESFGDMQEELAIAISEEKFGVMVMFETNDCPWCERMKRNIFNRSSVQDYFRGHFQIILINAEGDTPIIDFDGSELVEKDFALTYNRIRATPTFLFFDRSGQLVTRHTGTTKDKQEFLWLGEYVVDGHYKNQRFIHFKRKKREQT